MQLQVAFLQLFPGWRPGPWFCAPPDNALHCDVSSGGSLGEIILSLRVETLLTVCQSLAGRGAYACQALAQSKHSTFAWLSLSPSPYLACSAPKLLCFGRQRWSVAKVRLGSPSHYGCLRRPLVLRTEIQSIPFGASISQLYSFLYCIFSWLWNIYASPVKKEKGVGSSVLEEQQG